MQKIKKNRWMLGTSAVLLVTADWSHAQAPKTPTTEIAKVPQFTLEFGNAEVADVLKLLAEQAEVRLFVSDDVRVQLGYIKLKDVPFETALEKLTASTGLSWGKVGPDTYLVTRNRTLQVPTNGTPLAPVLPSPAPRNFLFPKDPQPLPEAPRTPQSRGFLMPNAPLDKPNPDWKPFDFNGLPYYLVPLTPISEPNSQSPTVAPTVPR